MVVVDFLADLIAMFLVTTIIMMFIVFQNKSSILSCIFSLTFFLDLGFRDSLAGKLCSLRSPSIMNHHDWLQQNG